MALAKGWKCKIFLKLGHYAPSRVIFSRFHHLCPLKIFGSLRHWCSLFVSSFLFLLLYLMFVFFILMLFFPVTYLVIFPLLCACLCSSFHIYIYLHLIKNNLCISYRYMVFCLKVCQSIMCTGTISSGGWNLSPEYQIFKLTVGQKIVFSSCPWCPNMR